MNLTPADLCEEGSIHDLPIAIGIFVASGQIHWEENLSQLGASPKQILIGMEATSCSHENLYHELERRGYVLRLLHPRQTHQFHEREG